MPEFYRPLKLINVGLSVSSYFASVLANHRPELKLDKNVSLSAARIQMIRFPAPQIFMTHHSPPLLLISIALPI